MALFTVRLKFHGALTFFLKGTETILERHLNEKTSVKDVIESCGVPHTEVDLILVDREPVDFAFRLERNADVDVHPVEATPVLFPAKRLQARNIMRFIADGHLGKLVRDLRLLGFDVLYDRDAEDRQLLEQLKIDPPSQSYGAAGNHRTLLTRDRRLLMHAIVRHGYYLRSQDPFEQTLEVIRRFGLAPVIYPFTRCLRCNAPLEKVDKRKIFERLEPLTKKYYDEFRHCSGCDQVYWGGSHFSKLKHRIALIRARLQE